MQWSPTEDLIFYVSGDSEHRTMHAVKYTVTGSDFTPFAPETLFTLDERERYDNRFDITADGKRFLFTASANDSATRVRREPTIVLNWTKELESIVPAE